MDLQKSGASTRVKHKTPVHGLVCFSPKMIVCNALAQWNPPPAGTWLTWRPFGDMIVYESPCGNHITSGVL